MFHHVLSDALPLSFDADDVAADDLGRVDFDLLATGLVDQIAQARILRQVDGERPQGHLDGIAVVVIHSADLAAVAVVQDEALEQVVNVCRGELQVNAGVAFDGAFALKIADAAAEEDTCLTGSWAAPDCGWPQTAGERAANRTTREVYASFSGPPEVIAVCLI